MIKKVVRVFVNNPDESNMTLNDTMEDIEAPKKNFSLRDKGINLLGSLGEKASSLEEKVRYPKTGLGFISVGFLFITLSVMNIYMIAISPTMVCSFLSLGSICCLIGVTLIAGPKSFCKKLFEGKRSFYTIIYLLSLISGFYFSWVSSRSLYCLLSMIVQVKI